MKDKLGRKRIAKFVALKTYFYSTYESSVSKKTKCTKKDCMVKQGI